MSQLSNEPKRANAPVWFSLAHWLFGALAH